jgi:ABC-2 type transport system ATP-binding protein
MALANALLHRPKILFLDEPTAGVDPLSRRALWELLYTLADQGVALFVTTHYMEEAERCNQIAFIAQGKLLSVGTPEQLKHSVTGGLLEVECRPLMKASKLFSRIDGLIGITAYGTSLHLNVRDEAKATAEVRRIAEREKIELRSVKPIPATLEDVFATLEEVEEHGAN